MLGQYYNPSVPTTFLRTLLTVPIPNLPVSVAEKALESLSSHHFLGGMKDACIISFLNQEVFTASSKKKLGNYLTRTHQISPLLIITPVLKSSGVSMELKESFRGFMMTSFLTTGHPPRFSCCSNNIYYQTVR
jgi:hypothetical protein